jgi:hypothetical protein
MKKCTEYTLGKTIISSTYDEFSVGDFDFYGTYDQKYTEGCIVRADGSFYEDHLEDDDYKPGHIRNELSFFHPADNGEKFGTPEYRKYALQDYQRMTDYNNNHWSYLVVKVETKINTDSGLSDGVFETLSSVESDGGKEYFKEIIDDLKSEVKAQLYKMGFSEEEINQSLDNSELKKGECYL